VHREELFWSEPFFFNQRRRFKAAGKDLPGVIEHGFAGFRAAEGCGGADAHQLITGALQTIPQTADQAGEVGALGAIKGVEFIHHQITKNPGLVVLPEALHMGLDQQVVELLVVGEQDVGWSFMQCFLVCDHAVSRHG